MSNENIFNGTDGQEMPAGVKIVEEKGLGYTLTVKREDLFKAASALKEAGFDLFLFASGVDYPDSIKLVYRVYSAKKHNIAVMIKTEVPKSDPVVDSLVPLWSAAGWHERETYDLYGVIFKDHPDLRRIFMPDDWVGHPLRKDYKDNHMLVMDDGKKDKAAAKDKATVKDKPASAKETAEKPETKAAKPSDAEAEPASTGTAETSTPEPSKLEAEASEAGSSDNSEQAAEASTDGSGENE